MYGLFHIYFTSKKEVAEKKRSRCPLLMCLKRAMPLPSLVRETFLLISRRTVTYLIKTLQRAFRCCMRPDPDDRV